LKKNELQPWRKKCWCIPERDRARFVSQLEDVIDLYTQEHSEDEPLICMDEASKQLLRDEDEPLPMAPGQPLREDYHYERRGTQALFMFFNPLAGRRRVAVCDSRTRVDWAEQIRILLEEDYPHARKVKLVCDNLNTHSIASLYEAFPAERARQLARRLEIHHTPRNGSWLNIAEIELSVLSRQCLDRRVGSAEELRREIAAWQEGRNADQVGVTWRFTTEDARIRLWRLYPQ
jgi:DDE superfamily endonuclease